mgnify:CR=1 FL=1
MAKFSPRAWYVPCLVATLLWPAASCTRGTEAAQAARVFYQALDRNDMAAARAMMIEGKALQRLEQEFGSFESWAGRVTKNGILARTEILSESFDGDGAKVVLILLYNDGTRRRDDLEMARSSDGRWLVRTVNRGG